MDSANFHVFEQDNIYFLYLANFKQVYNISKNEFDSIKNNSKNKEMILSQYLSIEDEEIEQNFEKNSYVLYLNIANACNAACVYCFAGQGNYGKKDSLMSKDIALKTLDFFFQKVPKENHVSIVFFGGEPLLSFNIIKHCCNYLEKFFSDRDYGLSITSNGTLLTKNMIDFFEKHKFKLALSIDGGEKIHNFQRPLKNGKNCFFEATKNLDYLFKKNIKVLARGTYYNFEEDLSQCYKDLLEKGFKEVDIVPDILDIKDIKQMKKLLKQLDRLYDYILEYSKNNDNFPFGQFVSRIRQLFLPKVKLNYTCGIGNTIICVDTKGDIYPCHRFSGENNFILGNIKHSLCKEMKVRNSICEKCWNRYTCSLGCAYEDQHLNKNTKNIYSCLYQKKLTELSILLCNNLNDNVLEKMLEYNS